MVINENMPKGISANFADITGIIAFPVPVLKGNAAALSAASLDLICNGRLNPPCETRRV